MTYARFLEKLLEGAKVEWVRLGDILVRTRGTKITASQMKKLHKEGGMLKIFAGGQTSAFVDFEDIASRDINKNPSIIVKSRGIIEFEYYDKPFTHKNEMWSYYSDREAIDIKYIYYFLKLHEPYFQNIGNKMQMPQISIGDTNSFHTPIPSPNDPVKSLNIQKKIAGILDKFDKNIADLISEYTIRQKQYTYYLNKLLTFNEGEVEWLPLEDIAFIKHGKDWKKQDFGGIPVYGSGGIIGYVDAYCYDKPSVLIPRKGSITNIFYVDDPFWNVDTIYYTEIDKTRIIPKYFYYFMKTVDLMALDAGSGRPSLTRAILNKIQIPIPHSNDPEKSLKEQARIATILDTFDKLTHSMSEGLPREIELRKKQYGYYRDLLFAFPHCPEE